MDRTIKMYGASGNAVRVGTAVTSDTVPFGEDGFTKGLITYTNGLDQNESFVLQGRNIGDTTWQTIATDAVATSAVGSRSLTVPWGELRISATAAGVPTSGTIQAILTRAT